MDPLVQRITAWAPSMRVYHDPIREPFEISSSFLSAVADEGLSVALERRQAGSEMTTDKRMGRGAWLHALFSGDLTATFHVAPAEVKIRRGAKWEAAVKYGHEIGAEAVLLVSDVLDCWEAWRSLWGPTPEWQAWSFALASCAQHPYMPVTAREALEAWFDRCRGRKLPLDSEAKQTIRAILRRWSPRFAEVSHRWELAGVPGCWCRIREDLVPRAPSGWTTVQFKTTEKPLPWFVRNPLLRSLAFYREGHRNLFEREPFRQYVVVTRFEPPYPWAIFDVSAWSEDLDTAWNEVLYGYGGKYGLRVPGLIEITETLSRGERHGPEEKGIQHDRGPDSP